MPKRDLPCHFCDVLLQVCPYRDDETNDKENISHNPIWIAVSIILAMALIGVLAWG
jgi:hypothetical protein